MITGLYAGLLALLYFHISLETIKARKTNKISLGFGKDNEISAIVSAHNNFASYTPFFLILTFLVESYAIIPALYLHLICVSFTIGRVLHFIAFRGEKMNFKQRVLGMKMTLVPLFLVGLINVGLFIVATFKA